MFKTCNLDESNTSMGDNSKKEALIGALSRED
jgi:hypothetical protein